MAELNHHMRDTAIRERNRRILSTRDKLVKNGFEGTKEALSWKIKQELSNVYTALPLSEIKAVLGYTDGQNSSVVGVGVVK